VSPGYRGAGAEGFAVSVEDDLVEAGVQVWEGGQKGAEMQPDSHPTTCWRVIAMVYEILAEELTKGVEVVTVEGRTNLIAISPPSAT